eukprot:3590836-Rhodomonas_salina.1
MAAAAAFAEAALTRMAAGAPHLEVRHPSARDQKHPRLAALVPRGARQVPDPRPPGAHQARACASGVVARVRRTRLRVRRTRLRVRTIDGSRVRASECVETETETETERQKDRETERQRDRETEKQRQAQTETHRDRQRQTQRDDGERAPHS